MGIRLDIELLAELITNEIIKVINLRLTNLPEKPIQGENLPVKLPAAKKSRVICYEDVKNMDICVFEVETGTIITPLAKDFIKDKKIKLNFI